MEKNKIVKFFWRITYSHVIAYFIAGIFALIVVNYKELFATDSLSSFMRPVTDPIVALGPVLQIFRGIIIAIILLPLRKIFTEEKYGFVKLGILILGLSLLSTIGPTTGSFEGYIYTTIPVLYQILGYPEAIIYILLFIGLLWISYKYANKKIITILAIIFVVLIIIMGIMGYLLA
jgi:hypothetical protein